MSAPFDRIQKIRYVQGATMGKGIVAVSRQRRREKFQFVSGSGFFSRSRRSTVRVCGRIRIVHGGRAALDKSPFDVCLSDFEWNGNRAWRKQGGTVNIISLGRGIIPLDTALSRLCDGFREEGVEMWNRLDLEWNEEKRKYSFFRFL